MKGLNEFLTAVIILGIIFLVADFFLLSRLGCAIVF